MVDWSTFICSASCCVILSSLSKSACNSLSSNFFGAYPVYHTSHQNHHHKTESMIAISFYKHLMKFCNCFLIIYQITYEK
uniref:Putative secreted protein n=1 Tax=Xenopsylla cheopis TaxID=163159 RepID=A0A6M2DWS9_XENCH